MQINNVAEWVKSKAGQYGGMEINLGELLCDRHARKPETVALFYEDVAGHKDKYTYAEFRELSARFATVLQGMGITKGDRVATLLPKVPELIVSTLAIWRLGAVHVPLFTAFGPEAVSYRVESSGTRVIVTNPENRAKVKDSEQYRVVQVGAAEDVSEGKDLIFWNELTAAGPLEKPALLTGDDLLILLYTSGTTGSPKGVEVPIKALASFEAYMRLGLDVRDEDVFWNMADPGWAYGLYYGVVGALLLGKGTLFFNAPFDAASIFRILKDYRVTNFGSAPTAYRALRNAGISAEAAGKLNLRVASSAGETLNPDLNEWAKKVLGVTIHDQYGQTELGMVINNHHHPALARELRPGSMGSPMPGFRMVVLGEAYEELEPGQEGELAVDTQGSPLYWFRGYFNDPARTAEVFTTDGRYYFTRDIASKNEDDLFFYASRADDVILTAGYRVGPDEVESALLQHEAVAEAAAVGKPDEVRGEVIKAFVVLKPGYEASEGLGKQLSDFVKTNFSAHAYPREVAFLDELPKTPSGKKQRFLLKEKQ